LITSPARVRATRDLAAGHDVAGGLPVSCLAATARPDGAPVLAGSVLAHIGQSRQRIGTVILVLIASADLHPGYAEALCSLRSALRSRGTGLRLVIASREARQELRESERAPSTDALPVHSCLREAVLATYAALPGPGLVTSAVRAALAAPAEPVVS
jgi:hypothetical protein